MSTCSAVAEMGHRLATIDMGPKEEVLLCPFRGGELFSQSNTMWPELRSTSVPSGILILQSFGYNRHGPKIGGCCAPFGEGSWVPI